MKQHDEIKNIDNLINLFPELSVIEKSENDTINIDNKEIDSPIDTLDGKNIKDNIN